MAEYEVYDSSGNHVGTFIEGGSDSDWEPSKPVRIYKRKVINKLINRISFFAFFALIVAYFAGIFDPSNLTFSLGMLGYILPLMLLDATIFFVTLRCLRAIIKIENYIINGTIDSQEDEKSTPTKVKEKKGVSFEYVDGECVKKTDEEDVISLENTIKVSHLREVVSKNASDKRCERLNKSINDAIEFKKIEKDEPVVLLDSIVDYYLGKYNSKNWIFKLTYLLFVVFTIFAVLENVMEIENVIFASLIFPFYVVSIILFVLSCYRTYIFYSGKLGLSTGTSILQIVKILLPIMSLVIVLCVILNECGLKLSYSMFIAGFAFTDLTMMLMTKSVNKKLKDGLVADEMFAGKFPWGKLILVEISLMIVLIGIIGFLTLGIEPVYKELEAYDSGLPADLTLPIRLWTISGGISLIIMIVVGILIVKKSKKKNIKISQEIQKKI